MLGHDHEGIVIPQNTAYAQEVRRWEATHTRFGPPGRPFVYAEFPKRLYKAARVEGKGIQIVDAITVEDANDERNMASRGYHFGPDAAIKAISAEQTDHGRLAAEREWEIRHGRLSEKAVAEVRAAEAAHGATHLPEVPATPIKRRGRKPKERAHVAAD